MVPPGAFRLFLASLVVMTHFTRIELGATAVYLFFVLSGFWVYRMFVSKYERSSRPATLFIMSRFLRILPLFLLFNSLALALHLALQDQVFFEQFLSDIIPNTLIIGYASLPLAPLAPAWSLDIELQFYIVFPLLFSLLDRLDRYAVPVLVCVLGLGGLYISFFVSSYGVSETIIPYIGFFLLGVFAARNSWKPSSGLIYGSAAILALGVLVLIGVPSLRGYVLHSHTNVEFVWNSTVTFAVALIAAPIALSSVYAKSTPRDRLIGDLSYVVYCSHWLMVVVATRFLNELGKVEKELIVMAMVALTYLASLFVLIYFDRPIGRWREAWVAHSLTPKTTVRSKL